MSAPNEPVVVLSHALDQTGDVLAAIHEDQFSLPTPCTEWDVARLVAHVVNDPRALLAMSQGQGGGLVGRTPSGHHRLGR